MTVEFSVPVSPFVVSILMQCLQCKVIFIFSPARYINLIFFVMERSQINGSVHLGKIVMPRRKKIQYENTIISKVLVYGF